MGTKSDAGHPAATLAREIGRWGLLALTVNCVVGAGILGLPGRVFALAGGATPWVVAGAALLATAAALCLAELGSRFDSAGGPVEYCRAAFGPAAGFAVGWLSWAATVLAAASLLNLLADLLAPGSRVAIIWLVGAGLTVMAMAGIGRSSAVSAGFAALKFVLLAAIAVAGLAAPAAPALPPAAPPFLPSALVLLFFAFVGFERPTAVAGEVANARRAVPFALIGGMALVTLVYAGIFAACLRGVPDLATSERPVAELAARLFGANVTATVDGAAALIVLGTLASQWITAPRLALALARDGQLPRALARISAGRRTPDPAILVTGLVAILLAVDGSFVGTLAASSASRLLIFIACAAALLRLRWRKDAPPARFRLPAGAAIASCVIVACIVLLAMAAPDVAGLFMLLVVGGMLWLIMRHVKR